MTTQTLEGICAHEAGHAAMCMLLGVPVRLVDVTGDETALGRTHHELGDGDHVTRMKIILGGLAESAESTSDLFAWPLDADHGTTDERRLALLAKALDLDRAGYREIVDEALELSESPEYKRLHAAICHELERHGQLDSLALARIQAITEGATVEHLLLKATTTVATDEGTFEAVISTEGVDREKDIVAASAMVAALRKWNRPIPLAWHHQMDAASIFGANDPASVHEVKGEVVASGQVDLESDVGREAWRSFKARTLGFSFGYLVPDRGATPRPGGGRHITSIDVFEITATPTPMNNDTRVLSTKALEPDLKAFRREFYDLMTRAMSHDPDPAGTLRRKSERIARECAPLRIKTFDA